MGHLIGFGDRLEERAALGLGDGRPAFYFDLGCPFSYLAAERVERLLGEVDWIPVSGDAFSASSASKAEKRAASLRLPLVWPQRVPGAVPGAMRAATYAAESGASARFALAAFRLAFCGGYDLDQVLGELASAVGISRAGCLEAAADIARDPMLELTARALSRRGVGHLPAFRLAGRFFQGEPALLAAAAALRDKRHHSLAHSA